MLNLPRVTGWGTDVMAGAAIRKSTEERANEEDRTRMVAQALLNQAQQGNFTEAGYGALETFGGKALADTYKQTAEQAKDDKRRQLEKMRFEKELIALKKTNEEVDLIDKFSEMGDTDSVKFLVDKANATYKALGLNVNLSPIMDAATRKTKTQEAVSAKLNEKIGAAEKNPTEDTIIAARDFLTNLGKGVKKEFIPIYEKRIAAAESRMRKEQERKQELIDFRKKEQIKREEGGSKDTALQEKIKETMQAYPGISPEKARRVAMGTLKVVSDPVSGNFELVDIGTGQKVSLTEQGVAPPETQGAQVPQDQTLWELANVGTGPWSAARSAASTVSGMVGGPIAEKTVYARQAMESAQQELIRSLSINPRFPVAEQERIKKEINITPAVFDNPKMMQTRMKAIDAYLKNRVNKERQAAANSSLPKTERQAALAAANNIDNFMITLGVPEEKPKVTQEDEALINKYLKGSK